MQPDLIETPKLDITQWPRVTAILEATGVADYSRIPNAEACLQRGRDIHMITADIDAGIPDYWTGGDLEPYAVAWQSFKEQTNFRPELIEHPVFHEVRKYRGTLDRLGRFGDQKTRVLLDLKSGIVADWVRLQTAAYSACLDSPETIQRYGLQLKRDGTFKISEAYRNYREDSNVFFALVSTIHARTIYGKTELLEGE